jgi:hypothetical protein
VPAMAPACSCALLGRSSRLSNGCWAQPVTTHARRSDGEDHRSSQSSSLSKTCATRLKFPLGQAFLQDSAYVSIG